MKVKNNIDWDIIIFDIINECYNKYFTCSSVIDEVEAIIYNKPLHIIINEKKKTQKNYPYKRAFLRAKVRNVLVKLHKEGLIKKYSRRTWEKV